MQVGIYDYVYLLSLSGSGKISGVYLWVGSLICLSLSLSLICLSLSLSLSLSIRFIVFTVIVFLEGTLL